MAYSSITNPRNFMNAVIYTGTGSSNAITGVGFQPDFLWIKSRSATTDHWLTNAISGSTKGLQSNSNGLQATYTAGTTSFDSDGFTCGAQPSGGDTNNNGSTYASWNWKANGTGSANTTGSINSTVSANTTSGFSIVTYTGTGSNATVGHGLGAVPKMIIAKETTGSANDWTVYNVTQGSTTRGILNENNAWGSNTAWNNTTPTSSVFSIGSGSVTNRNNSTYTAYCFADIQGFSKMGSYIGNGNANGAFIYTGFKPAFVMLKNATRAASWLMYDNKRLGYNVDNNELVANTTAAEETYDQIDILSNGFKMRANGTSTNLNGDTYIYMAFAEEPFVASNFNTATAR